MPLTINLATPATPEIEAAARDVEILQTTSPEFQRYARWFCATCVGAENPTAAELRAHHYDMGRLIAAEDRRFWLTVERLLAALVGEEPVDAPTTEAEKPLEVVVVGMPKRQTVMYPERNYPDREITKTTTIEEDIDD